MRLAGKRVVVTGGAGFLGSFVVERLRQCECATVVAPRRAEYDLRTQDGVNRLLSDHRPEVVFHLAAVVGGIGANSEHPGRFFHDNAVMGLLLIEACRQAGVEKTIVAGTICAYPKFTPVPFKEEDLWAGYPEETNAPYGVAKKALLVMLQAYRQEYGFNGVYLLPVNLYGPRDNFDPESSHVIPAMIRKFISAQARGEREVVLWGDGSPTREFLHVRDAAHGLVLAAERYDDPAPVNLGSGQEIAIRDLAGLIARMTEFTGNIRWDKDRPNGQPRRCLDTRRAWEGFGFRAEVRFEDGLRESISWYREHGPR